MPERGENIERCIQLAYAVMEEHEIPGEVIVVDNDLDDVSGELAPAAGATVIHEPRRGYGSAYLAGFKAASGDYIVVIDADLTRLLREIGPTKLVATERPGARDSRGSRSRARRSTTRSHHVEDLQAKRPGPSEEAYAARAGACQR